MSDDTATDALKTATKALAKIESHEAECARRWGTVRNILVAIFIAVLLMLIKQLGWFG